jgi:enoyl-CoA hydratase/carnithine racemase
MDTTTTAGSEQQVYSGGQGYVSLRRIEHKGQSGLLLRYANPDPRKLHAIDEQGMIEMFEALAVLEESAAIPGGEGGPAFVVFSGNCDPVHAGADITQFAGEPDYEMIKKHLHRGTELDARLKALWPRLRTVAVLYGDRYGGSVEWPLFCEFAVADSRCRIQFSEVHLGILPGWNGVLNVLLKSGAQNALYMGTTGNPVSAQQMQEIGLVQEIVNTPLPPGRNDVSPEQWPQLWGQYAESTERQLVSAALDLAVGYAGTDGGPVAQLASEAELAEELLRRTDPTPYRTLRDSIAAELMALAETDVEGQKALGKKVALELARLGKPLAPEAVEFVRSLVEHWGGRSREELLSHYAEAAREEADLCCELMPSRHRRIGVNAVLSKNPIERVPVFD